MAWIMYLIGGIAVGGVALAIYERRKNLRMQFDEHKNPTQHSERSAYTKAEAIRAEAFVANPPTSGGIF